MPESAPPVPGTDFRYGDHMCALYVGTHQRDELLLPFVRAGLLAGGKCVVVLDHATPNDALDVLRPGVDATKYLQSKQLLVCTSADTYLREGRFEAQRALDFWSGVADATGPFSHGCVAGELPATMHASSQLDAFMSYESDLNTLLMRYPALVLMCLYDLEVHGAELPYLLRTHPKLVLGGLLLDNPHYLEAVPHRRMAPKFRARQDRVARPHRARTTHQPTDCDRYDEPSDRRAASPIKPHSRLARENTFSRS